MKFKATNYNKTFNLHYYNLQHIPTRLTSTELSIIAY